MSRADEAGTASGLLNSSRQIGASLGLAALDTAAQHGSSLNAGYAQGLARTAVLLVAAVLVATTVLPRTPTTSPLARRGGEVSGT